MVMQVMRWPLTAQSYEAKIIYHPVKLNSADLSRIGVSKGVEHEEVERISQIIIGKAENCQVVRRDA